MACLKSCGICCFFFSLFAIGFLCVVGSVLNSGSKVIEIEEEKRASAASNCFSGAGIYGAFVAISILCYLAGYRMEQKGISQQMEGRRAALSAAQSGVSGGMTLQGDAKSR